MDIRETLLREWDRNYVRDVGQGILITVKIHNLFYAKNVGKKCLS